MARRPRVDISPVCVNAFQVEVRESRGGTTQISLRLPTAHFKRVASILKRKRTGVLLCDVGTKLGLGDVLADLRLGANVASRPAVATPSRDPWWCLYCWDSFGGIHQHEYQAKNWFNAFIVALFKCGANFQLGAGPCPR